MRVNVPAEASAFGRVTVAAMVNKGEVRATQVFQLAYNPSISASPANVITGGSIHAQGQGFPARQDVRLGLVLAARWSGKSRSRQTTRGTSIPR